MPDGPDVNNLFPAIAQSFAVILIGYLFGRFNIIPPGEAKSIGILVGKLALPALLFKNLAILNLSAVSWSFMVGVLIAKSMVFVVVAVLTLIVSRPVSFGKAGLFGIFATQSNDFALGLPIVQALYGTSSTTLGNFHYVSYIYLLAPVSLVIINPIGFLLMEYHKQSSRSKVKMRELPILIVRTLRGVVLNPVVFMTALGVIVNVVVYYGIRGGHGNSHHNLPDWLTGFLDILGGAYTACALFNIGIFMVGRLKKLTGVVIMVATVLIVAKTILLPILAFTVIHAILPGTYENSTRDDIATFGFLYGTFPTAPTVFVFASQYNLAMEIVAASLVLCTFMSAPIMFISARMVLITYASRDRYTDILNDTRQDVTAVSIASALWVMLLFTMARRYKSYLHIFVMHLMVAVFFECLGAELLSHFSSRHDIYWEFLCFSIFFPSVLAARIWMAWLALGLLLLLSKGPKAAERAWLPMMLSAWGIPIIITVVMVVVCATDPNRLHKTHVDVSFLFGEVQLVITQVILVLCFLVGSVCTILVIIKSRKRRGRNRQFSIDDPSESVHHRRSHRRRELLEKTSPPSSTVSQRRGLCVGSPGINSGDNSDSVSSDTYLPIAMATADVRPPSPVSSSPHFLPSSPPPSMPSIDQKARPQARPSQLDDVDPDEKTPLLGRPWQTVSPDSEVSLSGFGSVASPGVSDRDLAGKQLMRFIVLLMLLLFSCLVGILIVFWKLTTEKISGIFIAVNVLDTVTNFGQGFIVFAAFGFEKHWFWVALFNRVRRLWFKIEAVVLPSEKDLGVAVVSLCNTFRTLYLEKCREEIVTDKRYYLKVYENVFTGSELVNWLMERSLADTREEAVQYGHSLMLGRVLAHVCQEHYFHDEPYFYRFLPKDQTVQ